MTQKIFSHVKVVEQFKEPSSDSRKFLSTSKKLLKTDLISGINNFCTARKDPYLPESPLSCVSFSNSRQHPSYLYSQVNSFNKTVQQIAPAKPKSVAYTPRSTYVELPIPWQVDSGHPPKPKFLAPPRTELLCSCEPDDKLNLDHFINSHQQNLKHLESKISPLPRTMSSQQSIWNHLTMLVSQMIREYVQAQNLELELSNEAETCEILLQFFFQWIDKIWFNSIEASLKRVDCPPEAFEPYIKSFADHQTSIEKIKTIENAGAVHLDRISKNIEKPLRDAKGNRNSKLNRSEFIDSNTSKPITKSWALHSSKHTVSNSSVEALRELGLDDSIFGITRNTTHEEINKLVEASQSKFL